MKRTLCVSFPIVSSFFLASANNFSIFKLLFSIACVCSSWLVLRSLISCVCFSRLVSRFLIFCVCSSRSTSRSPTRFIISVNWFDSGGAYANERMIKHYKSKLMCSLHMKIVTFQQLFATTEPHHYWGEPEWLVQWLLESFLHHSNHKVSWADLDSTQFQHHW